MGLFSFVGKAIKGVAKVAGGVVRSGLVPLPFGGVAGKFASALLRSKHPMGTAASKFQAAGLLGTRGMRGQTTGGYGKRREYPGPSVLRLSPVLPGGAVATRSGVAPRASATPPATFGGSGTKRKRKRRSSSSGRKRSMRRRSTTRRRGRKLKFGSPAWRKKYLGHGRKKRRRRPAA